METKIRLAGREYIHHRFFDYVSDDEKKNILKNPSSFCGFIFKQDKEIFGAVLDLEDDRIHVRQVGGNFTKDIDKLLLFCNNLSRTHGKKYVSFTASRKAVEKIGQKLGFKREHGNQYYKAV